MKRIFRHFICIWFIIISVVLSGCGNNNVDKTVDNISESKDTNMDTSTEDQTEPAETEDNKRADNNNKTAKYKSISLYKTISKYSADGKLQRTINCEYDTENKRLVCSFEGSNKRYEFGYDAYGRLNEEEIYDDNGIISNWIEYDSNGDRKTDIVYSEDGNFTGYQYQYNENGTIEQKTTHYSSSGDYYITQYENNKETKRTYYNNDDEAEHYDVIDYDADGNMIKETSFQNDGSIEGYSTYEYDSYGNMISKVKYNADGKEILNEKYTFECDDEGRIIREYGEQGNLIAERIYDAEGNVLIEKGYNSEGIVISIEEKNEEGKLIRNINYGSDGVIWSGTEYSYDNNGRVSNTKIYNYGRITQELRSKYELTADGQVAVVERETLPNENLWEKQEFRYDSDGNLLSESVIDHFGEKVIIEYQPLTFQAQDEQMDAMGAVSIYYRLLKEYNLDLPEDTSKYYDYLLCKGGGYMVVAKEEETVNEIEHFIGVLDDGYNWVIPLSSDTPLHNNDGRLVWNTLDDQFDRACSDLKDQFHYAGDGVFIWAEWHFPAEYYLGKMLLVNENKWVDLGVFDSSSMEFTNGCLITVDCSNQNEDNVKIIYSSGEVVPLNIYCKSPDYIGQYSEGLFFAYDGFYNLDGERLIDLSEYAGKIKNQPCFENEKCSLLAENENGTVFVAEIDKYGRFISEFTKRE